MLDERRMYEGETPFHTLFRISSVILPTSPDFVSIRRSLGTVGAKKLALPTLLILTRNYMHFKYLYNAAINMH